MALASSAVVLLVLLVQFGPAVRLGFATTILGSGAVIWAVGGIRQRRHDDLGAGHAWSRTRRRERAARSSS